MRKQWLSYNWKKCQEYRHIVLVLVDSATEYRRTTLTSAILSKRANKSFKIFTNSWADVLLANSVKPFRNRTMLCNAYVSDVYNTNTMRHTKEMCMNGNLTCMNGNLNAMIQWIFRPQTTCISIDFSPFYAKWMAYTWVHSGVHAHISRFIILHIPTFAKWCSNTYFKMHFMAVKC